MEKIQRYNNSTLDTFMDESKDGFYVKFTDHQQALADQKSKYLGTLERVKKYFDEMCDHSDIAEEVNEQIQELKKELK